MFGVHIRKTGVFDDDANIGIVESAKNASDEWKIIQIMTHGPRTFSRNKFSYRDLRDVNIRVVVHSTYLSQIRDDNFGHLFDQLDVCRKIKSYGLVIHMQKGYDWVVFMHDLINKAVASKTKIILEMASMKPAINTHENTLSLNRIIDMIGREKYTSQEWGFCIDTAHLWAGGLDISKYADMRNYLREIDHKFILLFHLNGSSDDKGSGRDTHQIPFSAEDKIFKEPYKQSGVYAVVKYAKKYNIPVIFEINRGTRESLLHLRQLIGMD